MLEIVCFRCLNTFNSDKSFASHHDYCKSYEAIKIDLPEEGYLRREVELDQSMFPYGTRLFSKEDGSEICM